mmetsp:Transcript_74078/g.176428  ORF Transcript_74078/g.176428 Transcript_74078/m.176428 type:complete len:641 (+) Transcript_74078:63-1985(+)
MATATVVLSDAVYRVCVGHALMTEREEVMGLLFGDAVDGEVLIWASQTLHRSDKRPDRCEISPEQLCMAATTAERLTESVGRTTRVIGWYHSHPHITNLPSHVDLDTQAQYQVMDKDFVGLIFAVFNQDNSKSAHFNSLLGFRAEGEPPRRRVPLQVDIAPMERFLSGSTSGLNLPGELGTCFGQPAMLEIAQQMFAEMQSNHTQVLSEAEAQHNTMNAMSENARYVQQLLHFLGHEFQPLLQCCTSTQHNAKVMSTIYQKQLESAEELHRLIPSAEAHIAAWKQRRQQEQVQEHGGGHKAASAAPSSGPSTVAPVADKQVQGEALAAASSSSPKCSDAPTEVDESPPNEAPDAAPIEDSAAGAAVIDQAAHGAHAEQQSDAAAERKRKREAAAPVVPKPKVAAPKRSQNSSQGPPQDAGEQCNAMTKSRAGMKRCAAKAKAGGQFCLRHIQSNPHGVWDAAAFLRPKAERQVILQSEMSVQAPAASSSSRSVSVEAPAEAMLSQSIQRKVDGAEGTIDVDNERRVVVVTPAPAIKRLVKEFAFHGSADQPEAEAKAQLYLLTGDVGEEDEEPVAAVPKAAPSRPKEDMVVVRPAGPPPKSGSTAASSSQGSRVRTAANPPAQVPVSKRAKVEDRSDPSA